MKILLILLFPLWTFATNKYVANAGNDAFTGTQAQPYRTIYKVNSIMTLLAPGDTVFFKSGDIFYGTLFITKSGSSVNPIVFTSYGIGAKPIFSGLVLLDTWSNIGGQIWQCIPDSGIKANCNVFTISNIPYATGRTPNSGFLTYTSSSTTNLVSVNLAGIPNGAELVIRKSAFVIQRGKITSIAGNTANYTKTENIEPVNSYPPINGLANYGFFAQRFLGSLDTPNEWYTDGSTMKMYSTVNPNTLSIKVSFKDTLVAMSNISYVVIKNIAFEGAGRYSIYSKDCNGLQIISCGFDNNTLPVAVHNTTNTKIDNCVFTNSFNNAIYIYNSRTQNIDITNCNIDKTGLLLGMEPFYSNANGHGIFAFGDTVSTAANHLNITNNRVTRTGYDGIRFQGSNVNVLRNVVDTFCTNLDDGGGIYTYHSSVIDDYSKVYLNRYIAYNFVSNSIGASDGSASGSQSAGIYFDNETRNVISEFNTVWNVSGTTKGNGFQTSDPVNIIFRFNNIYNTGVAINMNKNESSTSNVIIHKNILYQKVSTNLNFRHINTALLPLTTTQSLSNLFDMDSNWITDQNIAGYNYFYRNNNSSPYVFPPNFNLTTWRSSYDQDVNSSLPPIPVTNINTRLEINPSASPVTIGLGANYRDAKNVLFSGIITLAPWTSNILIYESATGGNIPPTVSAGTDSTITLPDNDVNVIGTAGDADGTVTVLWTKFSGHSGGTITSPTSLTTTITAMTQGDYQYKITATDNLGATTSDIVVIHVLPSIPPTNQPPTILYISPDKTIQLPTNIIVDTVRGADTDGTIIGWKWIQISGPSTATISNPTDSITTFSSLIAGTYIFQGRVYDNIGDSAFANTRIIVNPAVVLINPVAHAGNDTTVVSPDNVTLSGSGTDVDGTISSYQWKEGSTVLGATAVLSISPTVGPHTYTLIVTDNNSLIGSDTVDVIVLQTPPPVPAKATLLYKFHNN